MKPTPRNELGTIMNMPAMNLEAAGEGRARDAAAQIVRHYRRIAKSLPGNAIESIRARREAAIAAFETMGLPHRRVEEWKYTDLRRMMSEAFALAEAGTSLTAADVDAALGELAALDAIKFVFVNGHFSQALSTANNVPSGVELMSLAKALYAPADWLLEALGNINAQERDVVGLLNTAFMTDGVVLRLKKGTVLAHPLHLIHVAAGDAPASAALRNVIIAEDGADGAIIESYVSLGDAPAQMNVVTEVRAAAGAKIRHYKNSSENQQTQHLASVMVELAERADYQAVDFSEGTALSRHQTFLSFNGDDARGHFYGAQLLGNRQHCDMTLVINHDSLGCESREHVKAVLADHAQGVFQAKVIVQPGAQKTDGRQMAQALLLSENAEFDAKPELEIYADDVKCNHGATSGALDEDLMFYMRARGLSEQEARSLLIRAFIGEVVDKVEHDVLREALMNRTAQWLG
jgi:Fe-S cluster assembly protein SufD